MIKAVGLKKSFGDFLAVSEMSFSAPEGSITGFLGVNGAGKTTTLRILSTCIVPTSGSAEIAGFDIVSHADEVKKRIGYLPESPPLYSDLTVRENLEFAAQIKGVRGRRAVREAVDSIISDCSLEAVVGKLCGKISRGFRQRTGLAQALVTKPAVVLLDEPASGLDPEQMSEFRSLITSLKGNHTVLFSTHILSEVVSVCDRVIIVSEGRVVTEGALEELTRQQSLEELFLESVNLVSKPAVSTEEEA